VVVAVGTDAMEGAGAVGEVSVVRGVAAMMEAGAPVAAAAAAALAETSAAAGVGRQGPGQCSDVAHTQQLRQGHLTFLSMGIWQPGDLQQMGEARCDP
jgi:hypothetical protein